MTDTTANRFGSSAILDGIRRWVEIETPTEAPEQINKLADLVTEGYRGLPATIERRILESPMRVNARVSARPSDVARKSDT